MKAPQSRIFISYSHRGNGPEWKAWLVRHLGVFEQHHLLDVWQDGKIRVSSYWNDDIKQAMASAQVAVVLLTKEALESEYILNTEFPFLRERQQRDKLPVFPVICEPCDWKAHDWLRATQAPNESNPLSQLSDAAQDRVFRQLATDIANELSRVALHSLYPSDGERAGVRGESKTYLDKFPLTRSPGLREEKLIGREQELALLDLAFAQPHTAIVSLVAWGGVGKTMLVQHWLRRLLHLGSAGVPAGASADHQQSTLNSELFTRVYAWSFYSQGTKEDRQASEDTFLAHALEWFGVQCEPTLSPWDKGRLLADAVARERTVLILDGIEPLQYPPGPMGGQLRAPGVQSLLKQLARKANSEFRTQKPEGRNCLCLVTTREPLTDLADFQRREGSPWGSVLRVDLGNLTDEAGAALLHHAGTNRAGAAEIKPDAAELLAASREVDGHALTLNLLGRFLARAHGGDIRRRDLVKFEEADRKEQGGTTFKMLAAFENWFARSGEFGARQLAILRILGLFDRPADASCIGALRQPPVIVGLTDPLFTTRPGADTDRATSLPLLEEDWNIASSFLADFGLVVIQGGDSTERLLDCHPLIREHFAADLSSNGPHAWQSAHDRVYQTLTHSYRDVDRPTIQELTPLYQCIAHGCKAGRQQLVCDVIYRDRIQRRAEGYSTKVLGLANSDLQAIACFFRKPWTEPDSGITNESAKTWLFYEAGFALRALGRLTEALEPMRLSLDARVARHNWGQAAIASNSLTETRLAIGEIVAASAQAWETRSFAIRSQEHQAQEIAITTLADVTQQLGLEEQAAWLFEEAEQFHASFEHLHPLLYTLSGARYCDLLLTKPERSAWLVFCGVAEAADSSLNQEPAIESIRRRAARTLDWVTPHAWLLDIGLDRLSITRASLCLSILNGAAPSDLDTAANAALDALRKATAHEFIARGLLTRAWLHYIQHEQLDAQNDLDEAWDIAERGPMRLHMADIHLYRARLFFREKSYPWKEGKNLNGEFVTNRGPADDLAAAEKLINDCGYHRRDQELADAKRAILGS